MSPLLAFLFFQYMQPLPAPAEVPSDFRLAGRDGPRAGLVDINFISQDASGRLEAFIYFIYEDEPPAFAAIKATFDCAGGTLSLGRMSEYNRALERTSESATETPPQAPQPGSIYAQAHTLVCSSGEVRRTYPYMGSDMRSAIRAADARFR